MRFKDLPHPHLSDLEPCAYVTDGTSLFEVIEVESGRAPKVILEDCSTGEWYRPAPTVPDRLEAA